VNGKRGFRRRKGRESELADHVAVALEGIRKELDRYRTPGTVELDRRELMGATSGRVEERG
jgi:hypothetical protein